MTLIILVWESSGTASSRRCPPFGTVSSEHRPSGNHAPQNFAEHVYIEVGFYIDKSISLFTPQWNEISRPYGLSLES